MRYAVSAGCILAALAVILGAFGAHALQGQLSAEEEEWYQKAVQYHLIHSIAMILSGQAAVKRRRGAGIATALFLVGILLFSGSLYLLATTDLRTVVVLATPAGGMSFIVAWLLLAISLRPRS